MPARHAPIAMIGQYQALHVNALAASVTPVGLAVDTTSATTISAGSQVVTPASMTGIRLSQMLVFAGGTGAAEAVRVTALTSTTFTATFANSHSGAYHITSLCGTKLGGVVINSLGTSDVITLYNGSPNSSPAGAAFAIISPAAGKPLPYNCTVDKGLYYSVTGTAAGDYTILYIDDPLGS